MQFLDLILGAGLIVQGVFALLALLSVSSWAIIFYKARELRSAELDTESFLDAYLERPLDSAYEAARRFPGSPFSTLFSAGYRDVAQLRRSSGSGENVSVGQLDAVANRLGWIETEEAHRLERGLSFLATTGSAAPFIGLFGTVVGIMNAFRDIGASGSASFAVVAPGIAEALLATAVGLFAAIPAVIAYNYIGARVGRMVERLEAFRSEFAQSLRRLTTRAA
jgi:biopolymer transport protein TolQ